MLSEKCLIVCAKRFVLIGPRQSIASDQTFFYPFAQTLRLLLAVQTKPFVYFLRTSFFNRSSILGRMIHQIFRLQRVHKNKIEPFNNESPHSVSGEIHRYGCSSKSNSEKIIRFFFLFFFRRMGTIEENNCIKNSSIEICSIDSSSVMENILYSPYRRDLL